MALVAKNPPANAGDIRDLGLIPGSGRCPGGSYGNTLQYSCLENSMDRGAWWSTVHGVQRVGFNWNDLVCMTLQSIYLSDSDGKESACNAERFSKIPWRRAWQPTPAFLPGESHGQKSLAGYRQSIGSHRIRHKVTHNWNDLACTHPREIRIRKNNNLALEEESMEKSLSWPWLLVKARRGASENS